MIIPLPTMNEWWRLTGLYPQYRGVANAILKDFGTMSIMRRVEQRGDVRRVLEFGHGYDMRFAIHCKKQGLEYWGVDDLNEEYFDKFEESEEIKALKASFRGEIEGVKELRFVKGRVGRANTTAAPLPENHFDMVCSVSVLEELPMPVVEDIFRHSFDLLRPGGELVCTYDTPYGHIWYPRLLFQALAATGFEILAEPRTPESKNFYDLAEHTYNADLTQIAIENPPMVMFAYQHAEGEDRKYSGHWTTLFFVAKKPE